MNRTGELEFQGFESPIMRLVEKVLRAQKPKPQTVRLPIETPDRDLTPAISSESPNFR